MTRVGIDLEQFIADPYGSGIQRVLQQLALLWPSEGPEADFVVPAGDGFRILEAADAAALLSMPFEVDAGDAGQLRQRVQAFLASRDRPVVGLEQVMRPLGAWLLPEVTYLPSVHQRCRQAAERMPVAMIGYDALPMTQPQNYRFRPGTAADVSEYFRLLVNATSVVCISDFTRNDLIDVLGRDPQAVTTVAHPGGDHELAGHEPNGPHGFSQETSIQGPMFLRVGTLEARKSPVEIARAFRSINRSGVEAQLVMVGRPSASDDAINDAVAHIVDQGVGVTWIQEAGDVQIHELMQQADAFLSFGTEGYGIPVLESLAVGTPVLFGGIQPAAELMLGAGARRILEANDLHLDTALAEWADPDRITGLARQIDATQIPTWRDFVHGVVSVL